MHKSVDADALDPTPYYPIRIGRAFRLIAAGGLLQTIGEMFALGASGALPAGSALAIFSSTALGIALLCAALRQPARRQAASTQRAQPLSLARLDWLRRLAQSGLLVLLLLAALWTIATSGALLIQHPLDPVVYDSDAAAFIHYQAEDVLRGINPYTDASGFWNAIAQFPHAGATPLQRGQFARQTLSPDDATVAALVHIYAQDPSHAGPEFDPASLHSYPAGSFLIAVPFIWAGFSSTQPLYALCLLLLFALLIRWSPQGWRWQTALLLLSLSIPITLTLRSSFEIACMLCIIAAWRVQAKHPWIAAFLLGVGCSIKQLAWLFLPFYLIWTLRQRGWRAAALAGAICIAVFFAVNAPFLLAAPSAWASSMLLPVTEPAFPGGIGLITLAQGGWIPLFPAWVYTALEIAAYLGTLGWFGAGARATNGSESAGTRWQPASDQREREWGNPVPARAAPRSGPQAPAAAGAQQFGRKTSSNTSALAGAWGLILAPLPLLFGPRSLISYTMFLPVLALAALFQHIHFQRSISSSAEPLPALVSRSTSPGAANE